MMAVIIYLILSIILLFNFNTASHIIASETSKINKKYEHFMPLVAFQCGYRNKFMNIDGRWQNDPSSVAGCLHGKYDILKYCKRVYPNEEINNIVEYTHLTKIDNWCREEGNNCKNQFTVRPFRCIGGEFVTESLQVPHRCHFDHFIGKDKCNDFKFWNKKGDQECSTKKETKSSNNNQQQLSLRSFALLEPCGLGMFRGVEFVCCPKDLEEKIEKIVVDLETPLNEKKSSSSDVEEEEDEDDEEYSDEDDDEENSIVLAPSPNELLIKEENEQKIINNYNNNNKHKELFSSYNNKEEENVGNLFEDANLIVLIGLIILTIIILTIILFLFKGKRNRHRGFIEVDVCTPEESHITGMQINGYENPTYAFFESKQPC